MFPAGAGDLTVFCSKGRQLVRCLQTKTSNLLSSLSIRGHQRARRMSRSEGDLRFVFAQVAKQHEEKNAAPDAMLMAASLPQSSTKLASSLITAGMSLAIPVGRTRSYSENNPEDVETNSTSNNSANNDSLSNNSCGSTPDESSLEDENDIESNENILLEYNTETRRVSNVSVASGVYETIADDSDEDCPPRRKIVAIPPPLPPREYKMKNGRRRGGLQAFFKIQKLWRSSSDGHVAKEEDEEEDCDELETSIYSEVLDLPFPGEDSVINHNLSTSCSNLSNKSENIDSNFSSSFCASSAFADIENILMIDSEVEIPSVRHSWDATHQFKSEDDENESIYLPMCHVKTTKYDRHRGVSESGLPSRTVNRIAQNCTALSDDSIYVTMNGSDRKASLTSEIYVLVTGVKPGTSSS
ncbi:hypothetical protein B566_EDAN011974 [Ephemera danica]|nr:hypothetical protein B566_EDAN011974 [Ephemera danica]